MGDNKKKASSEVEQIGKVIIGDDHFTIAADGNLALGLVNGYRVVDSDLYIDPISEIVPVMSALIAKSFRDKWDDGAVLNIYENEWDSKGKYQSKEFMQSLIDELGMAIGKNNVKIHPSIDPRSFIPEQAKLDKSNLLDTIQSYSERINFVLRVSEVLLEKTEAITRTRIIKTMWGADKIIERLEVIKENKDLLTAIFDDLGANINISLKALNRISHRITIDSPSVEDMKYVNQILIPDIINTFNIIKSSVSNLVYIIYPLYNIDALFKTFTGNPANWSLPGNLIEDVKELYGVLIDFLVDAPIIDIDLIQPLELLQERYINTTGKSRA